MSVISVLTTRHAMRTHLLLLTGIWLLWGATVEAQVTDGARQIYKAMGGPTQPRVLVHWNRYHDYAEVTGIMRNMAAAFPQLAKLESIGTSHEGRQLWVLTITNFEHGDEASKPGFWIDADRKSVV